MRWLPSSLQSLASWRGALLISAAVALWLTLLIFPYAPETYLDASWQETLIHAHMQHWQFGRDVIFTWGPWGFLFSIFHLGESAAGVRLVWELAGKLLLAGGLVAATTSLTGRRRGAVLLMSICSLQYFQDCAYLLFISTVSLALIPRRSVPLALAVPAMGLLSFLAQVKFTYALLIAVGVGLTVSTRLLARNWREAAMLAGSFVLTFIVWWLAAGQNPDHIWPYLRRSWEISTGYASAMSMEEKLPVFICGLLVTSMHITFFLMRASRSWLQWDVIARALYSLAAVFLVWKHGFTRADGHVLGFFLFMLPFTLFIAGVLPTNRRWPWLDLAVLPCIAGLWFFEPGLPLRLPVSAYNRITVNAPAVAGVNHLPAIWQKAYESARQNHYLPMISRVVGRAKVDVYNFEQGYALLNGLNFAPRPVIQGYSTYTPGLAMRNLRYYQSPRAPEFILWHQDSIDGRFPTLDEAPLYPMLARSYHEVLEEGDFLLLQRNSSPVVDSPRRDLYYQRSASLGETIQLPSAYEQALWIKIVVHPTKLGRLRSALYKPFPVQMKVVETSGRQTTWRLLPAVSEGGFLLHPFVETQTDFAAFLRGRSTKEIAALRVESPGGEEYWKEIEVRLYRMPDLPIDNANTHQEFVTGGIGNVAPTQVEVAAPLEFFTTDSGPAVMTHAPSSMTFAVPMDSSRLKLGFGLRSGAYQNGAHTDGVQFRAIARWPDGHEIVIWQRLLQPALVEADRGNQQATVSVPAKTTLTLETNPGTNGDTRWDWSYWTVIRFE